MARPRGGQKLAEETLCSASRPPIPARLLGHDPAAWSLRDQGIVPVLCLLFNVSLHLSQFIMPVARWHLVDCGGHGTSFTRRPTRGRRQRMVHQYVRWTSIRVFRLSRGGARRPKMRSCTTEAEKFQFFSGS
jgi:hypothetical protein